MAMGAAEELGQIGNFLNHICGCSESDSESILAHWDKEKLLRRNDFLLQKGGEGKYLWYILEGTLRIYYANGDQETCVGFGYPGTLLCAFPSFVKGKPSEFYIQALKKCRLRGISRENWEALRNEIPQLNICWYKSVEDALVGRIEREAELLAYNPQERLQKLMERSPKLFQTIPLRHIASYLDMAPETLSRSLKNLDPGQGNVPSEM